MAAGELELDHLYYWTRDMDAAVAFYRDVVGLELMRRDGDAWAQFEAGPVRFALHGTDEDVGGRSGTAVFRVDDLEAARWTLSERGARFEEHVGEVEGLARFATFRDPDGNPVQIIEYLH
jgi:predicted enzyme related to lactoylglutathione lyase